jgi:hypothetical protein
MAERGAAEQANCEGRPGAGISWTVDQLLIDVDQSAAALEWTGFNRQHARIVRGVDWFVFEPHTLCIQEIRPYAAALIHPEQATPGITGL